MIKVKDEKGLERDPHSKAILQTDVQQLMEHRRRKQLMKKMLDDSNKVKSLEDKVEQQSKELSELREMMSSLLSQINKQ